MLRGSPDWDLCRSFLAVIQERTLSGAARALGLTQPTLGRHIDALEHAFGQPLFVRSRSGLAPTDAALDLVPHAEAMAGAAAAFARAAAGASGDEAGTVRLTASEIVGAEVLPGILKDFRARHPAIAIELVISNRAEDLSRREADIAVRMLRPSQEALVARRIGASPIGLFAHRDYVALHGLPRGPEDLEGHTAIGPDADSRMFRAIAGAGLEVPRAVFGLRCDNDLAQHALLRAGAGIGGMQIRIAERNPDLVPVLPDDFRIEMDMWLVMHEDLRTSRPVRLLFDHLAQALAEFLRGAGAAAADKGGER